MTYDELKKHLNATYKLNTWPKQYKVDAHTYANCFQTLINFHKEMNNMSLIYHHIGKNGGIMIMNIELILENFEE